MSAAHPPLPEPALFAQVAGHGGSEFRLLAGGYDPMCAQYTAKQMKDYIEADRAARIPMTKDQFWEIWTKWDEGTAGYMDELVRRIEAHHGIKAP